MIGISGFRGFFVGIIICFLLVQTVKAIDDPLPVDDPLSFENTLIDPSAAYCDALGYQYTITSSPEGDWGFCQLPSGEKIDSWQFFLGDAGQDYNYCALKGYQTETSTSPDLTFFYLTDHVATCVLPDASKVEVAQLMGLLYDSIGFFEDRNNRPIFQPINDITINEGTPLELELTATDPNNDPLTFSSATMPVGAKLTNNLFCWTPSTGQAGTYKIAFAVSDGSLEAFQYANIFVKVPTITKIVPKTINLGSKGYFLAFVTLPEAYKGATIDMKTVSCSGAPAVRMMKLKLFPRVVGFVFKTSELKNVQLGNKVTLNVKGELKNNGKTYTFTGADSVKVISKPTWQPDDIKDISKESDEQLFKKFNT
jgi:putative hemolysin